jgi:hypothetical protein
METCARFTNERMTVAKQLENLSRDVEELRNDEDALAPVETIRKLSSIIRNLRRLSESASELYGAATVLAPRLESAELAVEVWEDIYKGYAHVSDVLERVPKVEPGIDNLIEESCGIFRDLVQKSAMAILEWDAEAEGGRRIPLKSQEVEGAVLVPNDETVAAIEEGKRNDLKSFNTVAELMADLNAED